MTRSGWVLTVVVVAWGLMWLPSRAGADDQPGLAVRAEVDGSQRPLEVYAETYSLRSPGQICNLVTFENLGPAAQTPIGTIAGNPTVTFGNSWLALIDGDNIGDPLAGNFANEPTASHIAFFLDPASPINFSSGVQYIEVFYSAAAESLPITLRGWTGFNGTGSLAATATGNVIGLDQDGASCGGDPTGAYCLWSLITLSAPSNNIQSMTLVGAVPNRFGFDNMTFCVSVPETGACCLNGNRCFITTSADCASQGGRYQGANSQCAWCDNIPPIPIGFPQNYEVTVNAFAGEILNMVLAFLSPEANQTTNVSIVDVNGARPRGLIINNTPGNVASIILNWPVDCTDEGDYRLDFTAVDSFNPPGVTPVSLTIHVICPCGRPIFQQSPQSVSVCPGESVTFTAGAGGDQPITYQWRKDGASIPGQTGTSLTINNVGPGDAGEYTIVATNSCSVTTSETAILTVLDAPRITQQPVNRTACPGDSVTFGIGAEGSPPLGYQWKHDGVDVPGATGSSHTINPVGAADGGQYTVTVTNSCGTATSVIVVLTVNEPIRITRQPVGASVCSGDAVTFSVIAQGTPPITYQWRRDGVDIPGATGPSLTIDPVTGSETGTYTVVVTNGCGSTTSAAAVLQITITPAITADPVDLTVCEGDPSSFSVGVQGSEPLTYQWYKDGQPIPGGTGSGLNLGGASTSEAGEYSVTVSNPCGTAASGTATLTVQVGPTITVQPNTQSACLGGSATFTVVATGTPPLSYQWQRNSISIPGATGATFTINPVTPASVGTYRVIVSNPCGFVTSRNVALLVNGPPVITQQPQGRTLCPGDSVTFTVGATGTPPLTYQWRHDGVPIPGATGSSYTIDPVQPGDDGEYTVVVTSGCGAVTSNAAMLAFDAGDLVILEHPRSQTLCTGDGLVLRVLAQGSPGPNYQWRKDGVGIPGATGSSFTITNPLDLDTGTYDVEVSNGCGSIITDAATVVVWPRGSADVNGDGSLNGLDIATFMQILLRGGAPSLEFCGSDMNGDGLVNVEDLPGFISRLLGR